MKKYLVVIAMSYIDTIEVEADNVEEAKQTAWDLFDEERAERGEGEVLSVEERE